MRYLLPASLLAKVKNMNAYTYLKTHSRADIRALCRAAKIQEAYFAQLALHPDRKSRRRPSPALALRLVRASGGEMTLRELRPDLADLIEAAA